VLLAKYCNGFISDFLVHTGIIERALGWSLQDYGQIWYRIHPVFHVSFSKLTIKRGYQPPLPMVDIIGGSHFEIEALIADRMLGKTNSFVLDGWKNEDAGGDTWEFEEDLIEDAPDSAPRLIKQ
jgi:hypothetical protein